MFGANVKFDESKNMFGINRKPKASPTMTNFLYDQPAEETRYRKIHGGNIANLTNLNSSQDCKEHIYSEAKSANDIVFTPSRLSERRDRSVPFREQKIDNDDNSYNNMEKRNGTHVQNRLEEEATSKTINGKKSYLQESESENINELAPIKNMHVADKQERKQNNKSPYVGNPVPRKVSSDEFNNNLKHRRQHFTNKEMENVPDNTQQNINSSHLGHDSNSVIKGKKGYSNPQERNLNEDGEFEQTKRPNRTVSFHLTSEKGENKEKSRSTHFTTANKSVNKNRSKGNESRDNVDNIDVNNKEFSEDVVSNARGCDEHNSKAAESEKESGSKISLAQQSDANTNYTNSTVKHSTVLSFNDSMRPQLSHAASSVVTSAVSPISSSSPDKRGRTHLREELPKTNMTLSKNSDKKNIMERQTTASPNENNAPLESLHSSLADSVKVQQPHKGQDKQDDNVIQQQNTTSEKNKLIGVKLCKGRFVVSNRIGAGSFGVLHSGIDTWSGKEVAIKFEPIRSHQRQLLFESRIYSLLHSADTGFHPSVTRYVNMRYNQHNNSIDKGKESTELQHDEAPMISLLDVNEETHLLSSSIPSEQQPQPQPPQPQSPQQQQEQQQRQRQRQLEEEQFHRTNKIIRSDTERAANNAGNRRQRKFSGHLRQGAVCEFKRMKEVIGFPRCYYYGVEGDYNVLVMDLLGPNLEELFKYCNRHFSLKTVCLLADQMLHRIEYFHYVGFIHRDLKPENFVMGNTSDRGHVLHLIDFGLSKRYWDARLRQHIPYKEGVALTGTARYCSINAHLGTQQSRRDDLESLGYILLYFLKGGTLPWQGIRGVTDAHTKNVRISEKKISTSLEVLCRDEPPQVYRYMKYIRDLKFDEAPDYRACREFFAQILERQNIPRDWIFDWVAQRDLERRSLLHHQIHTSENKQV